MTETNGATALAIRSIPLAPTTYSQQDFVRWQIVGDNVTKDEFDYFLAVANHLNLDPLRKQIYCVKRGNRAVVQTGIDGYRVIAARTGQLAGIDDAEYGPDEKGHPAWAKVTVWRMVQGVRCPSSATARWAEYKPDSGPMWQKMPYLMLAKCAEALALRKAFPGELSGLLTDVEMDQAVESKPGRTIQQPPADQEPPFAPPAGKAWAEWCSELAKELGAFDTKDDYLNMITELTGKDPRKVRLEVADWQKLAHWLQNEISLVDGLAEEDAGLAKMAGLDDTPEATA